MTADSPAEAAQSALVKSTLALDRIERHEETCLRRWGQVVRMIWVVLLKLATLLTFLLADKIGWTV